jgi:hypothetical protein
MSEAPNIVYWNRMQGGFSWDADCRLGNFQPYRRADIPWLPEELVERAKWLSGEFGTAHQRIELLRDILAAVEREK